MTPDLVRPRTTVVALVVVLLLCLLGPLGAGPAGATERTRFDVDLQRNALPGTTVYLTAALVGPGAVDRPVQVQQRRGSEWMTVARQRSESFYGVQFDLVVTGDEEAATAACDVMIDGYRARVEALIPATVA